MSKLIDNAIYRGKRIDSLEYVNGFYFHDSRDNADYILTGEWEEIDDGSGNEIPEMYAVYSNTIECVPSMLGSTKNSTSHSELSNQPSQPITTPSNKTLNIGMEKLEIMSKTPGLQLFFGKILQNLDRSTNIVKSIPKTCCSIKTKKLLNKLIELRILRYSRSKQAYVVLDGVYTVMEGV